MFSVKMFCAIKCVSVSGSDGKAGSVGAEHSMMRDADGNICRSYTPFGTCQ